MSYNYEGFLERARERHETNAAAKYLAELEGDYDQLETEYFAALLGDPDFTADFQALRDRHARFDAEFTAKDADSLADDLLEIEAATNAFNARVLASGRFSALLTRMQADWTACDGFVFEVPIWEGFGPMPRGKSE